MPAKKNKGGRPTSMTDSTLQKLKIAFMAGLSDEEACVIADITPTTLYNYQKKYPSFLSKKASWKDNVKARAKMVVATDIINHKNVKTAQWYLEHKDPEYANKQETKLSGEIGAKVSNPFSSLSEDELRKLASDTDG